MTLSSEIDPVVYIDRVTSTRMDGTASEQTSARTPKPTRYNNLYHSTDTKAAPMYTHDSFFGLGRATKLLFGSLYQTSLGVLLARFSCAQDDVTGSFRKGTICITCQYLQI